MSKRTHEENVNDDVAKLNEATKRKAEELKIANEESNKRNKKLLDQINASKFNPVNISDILIAKYEKIYSEELHKVKNIKKEQETNYQMHNFASMVMQFEPRFKALLSLYVAANNLKTIKVFKEYGIDLSPSNLNPKGFFESIDKYFSDKKYIDVPGDLHYFSSIDDNGYLTHNVFDDSFDGVLFDDNKELKDLYHASIRKNIEKWVEQVPGLNGGDGYFVGPDESDNGKEGKCKIYPKSLGKQLPNGGKWVIDNDKVLASYNKDTECKQLKNGSIVPNIFEDNSIRPRPRPRPIDSVTFDELRKTPGNSLTDFFEAAYKGLEVDLNLEEAPRNSP
ncbi:MAG: hypothetical protein A3E88_03410 [Legionellales bacterium RIFCSPHIGHO2_12_FULL_35_11]|nr:MAG: hypothetical protein A3E88_03410 [Legionellales bacterium RIFCSPHIGHO2_12_FULL_35_11]